MEFLGQLSSFLFFEFKEFGEFGPIEFADGGAVEFDHNGVEVLSHRLSRVEEGVEGLVGEFFGGVFVLGFAGMGVDQGGDSGVDLGFVVVGQELIGMHDSNELAGLGKFFQSQEEVFSADEFMVAPPEDGIEAFAAPEIEIAGPVGLVSEDPVPAFVPFGIAFAEEGGHAAEIEGFRGILGEGGEPCFAEGKVGVHFPDAGVGVRKNRGDKRDEA